MLENQFTCVKTEWLLGYSSSKEELPRNWFAASIPGAVQLDYAKANNMAPWYYNDNFREYHWMEDIFWFYKTVFKHPSAVEGFETWFCSKGIDYRFDIFINGNKVISQEGMYTPVAINLEPYLEEENQLLIIIFPVPKPEGAEKGQRQALCNLKPPAGYGCDLHPRLIPSGIWDDTCIQIRPLAHLQQADITQELRDDLSSVSVEVNLLGQNLKGLKAFLSVNTQSGREICRRWVDFIQPTSITVNIVIENPELWWPVMMGNQTRYTLNISLFSADDSRNFNQYSCSFGVRRIRLVMNHETCEESNSFPETSSMPPMTVEINNQKLFVKGTNWVQPDVFYGILDERRYREMLTLAVEANFNILRLWGGGPVNKEVFFDLCDELGLMVWQEIPVSCNEDDATPEFKAVLERESISIIKRLKNHPSLILWSGTNTLFNALLEPTSVHLLKRLILQYDPNTPFIDSTPYMRMETGAMGGEVKSWMLKSECNTFNEFGISSPAPIEVLNKIIHEEELFPPKPGTSWEWHHAFNAWNRDTWLRLDMLNCYFGNIMELGDMVEMGQLMQAEGLKFIYEEARRQEPFCSMALNWCFNEPWPSAASCSIVSWPAVVKPAYYEVKQACREALVSARPSKFLFAPGEIFSAELFFLNHLTKQNLSQLSYNTITVNVFIDNCTQTIHLLTWENVSLLTQMNVTGPEVKFLLPPWNCERFKLILKVKENPQWDSEYVFILSTREKKHHKRRKDLLNEI